MNEENARLDSLSVKLHKQELKNDSLNRLLEKSDLAGGYKIFFGRKFDSIQNPETYVTEALGQQKELIPLKAVLGGTMDYRKVQLLTEDWLLAIYDDGHVQGKTIFEYDIQPDGKIIFKEIATKRPK